MINILNILASGSTALVFKRIKSSTIVFFKEFVGYIFYTPKKVLRIKMYFEKNFTFLKNIFFENFSRTKGKLNFKANKTEILKTYNLNFHCKSEIIPA